MALRQPLFDIDTEQFGIYHLEDGSIIRTRIILSDLYIVSEDILGVNFAIKTDFSFQIITSQQVLEEIQNAEQVPSNVKIPITAEAGYERIGITETESEAISYYTFEGKKIRVALNISAVAVNMSYKNTAGHPLYNIRWNAESNLVPN